MSTAIDIHLSQIRFPSTCVVCKLPATRAYGLHKILMHGHSSLTVRVNVPMCDLHFHSASYTGTLEKSIGRLGLMAGILAGLVVMILSLARGEAIGQANLLRNLVAASVFAAPSFLMVWASISLFVAPLFAEPVTRTARQAVRLTRYWSKDQFVRLEFQDEQLADIVQNTYRPPANKPLRLKSGTPRF